MKKIVVSVDKAGRLVRKGGALVFRSYEPLTADDIHLVQSQIEAERFSFHIGSKETH